MQTKRGICLLSMADSYEGEGRKRFTKKQNYIYSFCVTNDNEVIQPSASLLSWYSFSFIIKNRIHAIKFFFLYRFVYLYLFRLQYVDIDIPTLDFPKGSSSQPVLLYTLFGDRITAYFLHLYIYTSLSKLVISLSVVHQILYFTNIYVLIAM